MVLPDNHQPTYGERMVRVKFNPSSDDQVAQFKQAFAALIDRVNSISANPTEGTVGIEPMEYAMHQGYKAQAIHYLDLAAMLAVKAATSAVEPMDPAQQPDYRN